MQAGHPHARKHRPQSHHSPARPALKPARLHRRRLVLLRPAGRRRVSKQVSRGTHDTPAVANPRRRGTSTSTVIAQTIIALTRFSRTVCPSPGARAAQELTQQDGPAPHHGSTQPSPFERRRPSPQATPSMNASLLTAPSYAQPPCPPPPSCCPPPRCTKPPRPCPTTP
jgi:uncharacterized membrane protein